MLTKKAKSPAHGGLLAVALVVACGGRTASVPQADGAPANGSMKAGGDSFAASCAAFATAYGKASCTACINTANGSCAAQQERLGDQCQVAFECGMQCFCSTAPCATSSTLCSCVAGCLPLNGGACNELWADWLQCSASVCSGHC